MIDIAIIGGGAAGLVSAINAKRQNAELNVCVFENLNRVGKKVSVTGNGRCNITNKTANPNRYHSSNIEFCSFALESFNVKKTVEFFESIGVNIIFEGDKGYPASFQASSVVDCLRFSAENSGVLTHTEAKVTSIKIERGNDYD